MSQKRMLRKMCIEDIELDQSTNEVYLWHGLPASSVPMVAHSGLDERIANCKGFYGAGIYLMDQWCKAQRSESRQHRAENFQVSV